jgi:hypothetical protein
MKSQVALCPIGMFFTKFGLIISISSQLDEEHLLLMTILSRIKIFQQFFTQEIRTGTIFKQYDFYLHFSK